MQDANAAAHDRTLSPEQRRSLRCLAEMMIPASTEFGVPSAGDDAIFADILHSFGRDADKVQHVMRTVETLSGGCLADLPPVRRAAVIAELRASGGMPLTLLSRIILQCYYRDDRVMHSLGMEVRPPFPKGFEVEQGDWSLLDPVRARAPFYRNAG
jgi:hypothetical protein